jgi:hypothetical protein
MRGEQIYIKTITEARAALGARRKFVLHLKCRRRRRLSAGKFLMEAAKTSSRSAKVITPIFGARRNKGRKGVRKL